MRSRKFTQADQDDIQPRIPEMPEARQAMLVNLAELCAERQLREGTASSAVIVHYLKLATEHEKLERLKLEAEVELAKAKVEALAKAAEVSEKYEAAIAAMKKYSGNDDDNTEVITQ